MSWQFCFSKLCGLYRLASACMYVNSHRLLLRSNSFWIDQFASCWVIQICYYSPRNRMHLRDCLLSHRSDLLWVLSGCIVIPRANPRQVAWALYSTPCSKTVKECTFYVVTFMFGLSVLYFVPELYTGFNNVKGSIELLVRSGWSKRLISPGRFI